MWIDLLPDSDTRVRFYPEGGCNVSIMVPGIGWVVAEHDDRPDLTVETLDQMATHAIAIFRFLNP